MKKKETIKKIMHVLHYSDIVWSKYGSETIEDLAKKIYREIVFENEFEINPET